MSSNAVLNKNSRYVQGGTTDRYRKRLGWWERRVLRQDDTDAVITIDNYYHRRPDRVAKRWYGTEALTWLVLQFNNIVDINTEFVAGKEIRLPAPTRVNIEMLNQTPGGKFVTESS